MKRIISLTLCILLATSLFGCSGGNSSGQTTASTTAQSSTATPSSSQPQQQDICKVSDIKFGKITTASGIVHNSLEFKLENQSDKELTVVSAELVPFPTMEWIVMSVKGGDNGDDMPIIPAGKTAEIFYDESEYGEVKTPAEKLILHILPKDSKEMYVYTVSMDGTVLSTEKEDAEKSVVSVKGEIQETGGDLAVKVVGYNPLKKAVWTYQSKKYEYIQAKPVTIFGEWGGLYLIGEDGATIALNKKDGSVAWKNTKANSLNAVMDVGTDCVYILGGLNPVVSVLDAKGELRAQRELNGVGTATRFISWEVTHLFIKLGDESFKLNADTLKDL